MVKVPWERLRWVRRFLALAWLPGRLRRAVQLAAALALGTVVLTCVAVTWGVLATSVERPSPAARVNDVTRLNPIIVDRVITPTTIEEIADAVGNHSGSIAIGGGRFSMGGQIGTPGALHIDLRRFNRILDFSPSEKLITVQAGTRWRQIQVYVDSTDLSVKIMQTYADFTVGGSVSVNVHGRYVGLGPLILSVRSLKVVLADGSVVTASRTENAELFYGVIGGYGGLGVIVEATLELADNVRVKRHDVTMPISEYGQYFAEHVRTSPTAIFHNADIYPNGYSTVHSITFSTADDPVTVADRLIPAARSYAANRFLFRVISGWPFGKAFRRWAIDPVVYRGEPVMWRNYEASYTVMELEPSSRDASTYVLQEYFVPVDRFDEFVPGMRDIFQRHDVNVINVSIRHALPDPGSILAWARDEVFAFVVYYKQKTDEAARADVGTWTRELIDSTLAVGGAWYLPYQIHATEEQFLRGYPRAPEYFALKRRVDPEYKFRNSLWERYYRPDPDGPTAVMEPGIRQNLSAVEGYRRDEGQTFLTHPEWYIVYNSDEFASHIARDLPTSFPYVQSIGQYWRLYGEARSLTANRYPPNWGYHVMLGVIGTSYSAELALRGLYENTTGRISGWTAGGELTDEDRYAARVAADYGQFIHVRPWYEFPFGQSLLELWTENSLFGRHVLRKWERRFILSLEYGVKALYGGLIGLTTKAAYGVQDDRIQMVVTGLSSDTSRSDSHLEVVRQIDAHHALVATPRYDAFRDAMLALAMDPGTLEIREIAGNDEIFLTGVAPATWMYRGHNAEVSFSLPLPTDRSRKRVAMRVGVPGLLSLLGELRTEGLVTVDHIYDY